MDNHFPETRLDISFVGENMSILGSVESKRDIIVYGKITGTIHCEGKVFIEKGGVVAGDVFCNEIQLNGIVNGNIVVGGSAYIKEEGIIKGFLETSRLVVHPGATIEDGIKIKESI